MIHKPESHEAIVVLIPDADPDKDRYSATSAAGRTTVVPVPDVDGAVQVSLRLVEEGVGRIELCGGLGPAAAGTVLARLAERGEHRVPVGAVSFGIESVEGAARFQYRIESHQPMTAGFIFLHPGLDPVEDRGVIHAGGLRTLLVPVPDQSRAASVAAGLVEREASELIELYRGIGSVITTSVIGAVAAKAPVGAARYEPA